MSDVGTHEMIESAPLGEGEIKIPVKFGCKQEREIVLKIGSNVTAILDVFASEWGVRVEELLLVREGEAEALVASITVDIDYPHRRRHHVHHARDVNITAFYQAGSHHQNFERHATVEDVLTWAVKVFNIDAQIAPEFELALHNTSEQLPGSEHIGHLAGCHHDLLLDVIRGDIANGGSLDH